MHARVDNVDSNNDQDSGPEYVICKIAGGQRQSVSVTVYKKIFGVSVKQQRCVISTKTFSHLPLYQASSLSLVLLIIDHTK